MRTLLIALSAAFALFFSGAGSAAAADKCPLRAAGFMLVAQGQTGHVDRYVITFALTGRDPMMASLAIPGVQNDIITPVIAPAGSGDESVSHYVIDVPRADSPTGISVLGVLPNGRGESLTPCKDPVSLVTTAPSRLLGSFDDSSITFGGLLVARPVTEAHVLSPGTAEYTTPTALKRIARVVISLLVATGGAVAEAHVAQSSGYPSLDAAALSAARRTTFTEPQFGGAPIPLEYLVTYSFKPR